MSDVPDELVDGLRELAERELPPPAERFEAGVRQTLRWDERRRRGQRRRLVVAGCLIGLLAALGVALALPVTARYLPLPIGHELRRLDSQASGLQARLAAQAAADVRLRHQLAETVLVDSRRAPPRRGIGQGADRGPRRGARGRSGWVWVGPRRRRARGSRAVVAPPLASAPSSTRPELDAQRAAVALIPVTGSGRRRS